MSSEDFHSLFSVAWQVSVSQVCRDWNICLDFGNDCKDPTKDSTTSWKNLENPAGGRTAGSFLRKLLKSSDDLPSGSVFFQRSGVNQASFHANNGKEHWRRASLADNAMRHSGAHSQPSQRCFTSVKVPARQRHSIKKFELREATFGKALELHESGGRLWT